MDGGGKRVSIYKNNELIDVYTSELSTTTPLLYETRHAPVSFHVDAGDRVHISSTYDNPENTPMHSAMGMVGLYYTEE